MSDLNENIHRRKNPLTGDWILVSPYRFKRPWEGKLEITNKVIVPEYDLDCYLCPGNKRAGGKLNPNYSGTFVFKNDFPALIEVNKEQLVNENSKDELFCSAKVSGECRVICFSPSHSKTIPQMKVSEILQVVKTWISQSVELGENYNWVQVFENKGEIMGCSNPHPHGQVWATNTLPTQALLEDHNQKKYYDDHGCPLLEIYAQKEIESGMKGLGIENIMGLREEYMKL